MTTQTGVFLAAALGLAALAGAAQADEGGSVVIHRGADAQTVRFGDGSGITVVRGQPAPKPAEPAPPAAWAGQAIAGDTLWLVDGAGERLVACQVRYTTQVGARRIRCIDGALR
jgi:hypothetical protein